MPLSLSSLRRSTGAAALAALLAACDSSSQPADEQVGIRAPGVAAVRAAAQTTADAGSSRFEITSTTTVGGESLAVRGEAVLDFATRNGSATFTLPGGAGTMEQRYLGDEVYLTVPGRPGYFRLAAADLVGTPMASTANGPALALDALECASDDVREVGSENVRGDSTTHYEGTLDADAGQVCGAFGDLAAAGLGREVISDVPFAVWIDKEGRMRRYEVVLDLPASDATGGRAVSTATRMVLYDFGVEVSVEPPPADQVQDGAPLLEALFGAPA